MNIAGEIIFNPPFWLVNPQGLSSLKVSTPLIILRGAGPRHPGGYPNGLGDWKKSRKKSGEKKRVKFQTQFSNSLSSWMLKMCWKPTGLKIHLPMVSLYRQGSWNAPSKVGSHMPQSSRCMVYLVGGLEHGFYFSMYWNNHPN